MKGAVLIVEDDEALREALTETLADAGYRVVVATNGKEALERLRAPDATMPSLILLDLMMPVMDGWQFRAEQRRDPVLAAIPVCVLSAAGQAASNVTADCFLPKPTSLDMLLETVARFCMVQ
jgi:CheY-like chemotaxis protein